MKPSNFDYFEFEIVTVNRRGEIIEREIKQAQYFTETLQSPSPTLRGVWGDALSLDLVAIPGNTFLMGSPRGEGHDSEKPQHEVMVQSFFMGKYPVTQAQWRTVAALPKVNRDLNLEPSYFKGDNRPVVRVSWYDANELCDRLSRSTGRFYRLPSEAEWEYACRAGTTTPFHFGETITSELANYKGKFIYGAGFEGPYRGETTDVGSFGVANAFGLYDMHGLVSEWCADHWHDNYDGAPTDASAWLTDNDNDKRFRLLRGGSWYEDTEYCRSAVRFTHFPDGDYINIGFRVVCGAAPRTLSP